MGKLQLSLQNGEWAQEQLLEVFNLEHAIAVLVPGGV